MLGSSFLISLIAFLGCLTLLREELLSKVLIALVAFSAGLLIGSAFFHLLPKAIEIAELSPLSVFSNLMLGFCILFVLEQFISWHHHHVARHPEIKSFSYLLLFSDAIHNFIDGLVLAASFLTSIPLGVITSFAIALHEIPQEIGDFGTLIYGGFDRVKALILNYISASTILLGSVVGYVLFGFLKALIVILLPIAAGSFIYIACSDLIPEIKLETGLRRSSMHFLVFLLGIMLMFTLANMNYG
jgi:zinc and cadmium transporter